MRPLLGSGPLAYVPPEILEVSVDFNGYIPVPWQEEKIYVECRIVGTAKFDESYGFSYEYTCEPGSVRNAQEILDAMPPRFLGAFAVGDIEDAICEFAPSSDYVRQQLVTERTVLYRLSKQWGLA